MIEAGSNRLKVDSRQRRHCRGHYHLEVRLWFRTVNRQRYFLFVYHEWANGMLEQRRLPLTAQCQPCLFIIATVPAKHVALFQFLFLLSYGPGTACINVN